MKRAPIAVVTLLSLLGLPSAVAKEPHPHVATMIPKSRLLTFDHMYGVDGPFVGDELPWTITGFIKGRLDTAGHLKILVRGLVFADDPEVPPDLRLKNDEEEFRAEVSCLTEVSPTEVSTANVTTRGFPATADGDSFIDAAVDLSNPCIAPIAFVLSGSEDKWFAVTGFESED